MNPCGDEHLMFPSMSEFVTSVGGSNGFKVWNEYGDSSGGGFNSFIDTPKWQTDAVGGYNKVISDDNKGRGYPDIASQAQDLAIVVGKNLEYNCVDGTSAATPISAGFISLINDMRLNKGLKPLGFLNPLLYKSAAVKGAFFDITEGDNHCCGLPGLKAAPGWDPVTGLGVMNFEVLKDLWTQDTIDFSEDKIEFIQLKNKFNKS